jgi:uncharacterized membrane protein
MTFLMAMVPVVELRGAIPYGVGIAHLSVMNATIISIIGNMVPVPFLILFTRRVFAWLRKKSGRLDAFVRKMEEKADRKKDVVLKYQFFGLALLVAIPLPGTGAWTGSLVAAMMDMQLKRALPAIAIGVLVAGVIVAWITFGASAFIQ